MYIKGSNGEVQSQLYRALDSSLINKDEFESAYNLCAELKRMILKLITVLKDSDYKGNKYKK